MLRIGNPRHSRLEDFLSLPRRTFAHVILPELPLLMANASGRDSPAEGGGEEKGRDCEPDRATGRSSARRISDERKHEEVFKQTSPCQARGGNGWMKGQAPGAASGNRSRLCVVEDEGVQRK